MDIILSFFYYIQSLGSVVFVPLIIMCVGLVFRLGFKKSLRAGVTVGSGFIGVNLILNIVWNTIGPISTSIVERFGLSMNVIDVGWAAASASAFSSEIGAFIIPFVLVINIILLVFRLTKTVNVDIWNYWHYAFTGSMIVIMTGSVLWGFFGAGIHVIAALKMGDICAERVEREMEIPGISIPHGFSATMVPIAYLLDKVYDKIPFYKIKQEKELEFNVYPTFEFLTEPAIIGLIMGLFLGILGMKYTGNIMDCIPTILNLGANMAALMLLMPRVVKLIMEGLVPISAAAKEFMQKKFHGRKYYIGLDAVVILGHPVTLLVSIILIPITLLLALILPGNITLPFADLAALSFFIALVTPIHRGSFKRTLTSGIFIMIFSLYCSSAVSPYLTQYASSTMQYGVNVPGSTVITTLVAGGNYFTFVISHMAEMGVLGAVLLAVITIIVVIFTVKEEKRFR